MSTERPSIRLGLDYIIEALDAVVEDSVDPRYRDEVAAEEVRLGQIVARAQLALRFIKTQRRAKIERMN